MRVPVTLVAGYLGAGKTSLVNACLKTRGDRRIAVLVNDFGEISIDAALIRSQTDTVLNLAGGCVCCSIGSDLMEALGELAAMPQQFDHVLLEASGVALPRPIAQSINLSALYQVESTVLVADASAIQRQLADRYIGDTVARQIEQSDWVLLSRLDGYELEQAKAFLRLDWPEKTLVDAALRDYDCEWLLELSKARGQAQAQAKGILPDSEQSASLWRTSRLSALRSRGQAADEIFESMSIEIDSPIDLEALSACLLRLVKLDPPGVLRAKGLLRSMNNPLELSLLQLAGSTISISPCLETTPSVGALVVIGIKGKLGLDEILACLEPNE